MKNYIKAINDMKNIIDENKGNCIYDYNLFDENTIEIKTIVPIGSSRITSIELIDGKPIFIYKIKFDDILEFDLNNFVNNMDNSVLFDFYGPVYGLKIKMHVEKEFETYNISFRNINEMLAIINLQISTDINYRINWVNKNITKEYFENVDEISSINNKIKLIRSLLRSVEDEKTERVKYFNENNIIDNESKEIIKKFDLKINTFNYQTKKYKLKLEELEKTNSTPKLIVGENISKKSNYNVTAYIYDSDIDSFEYYYN